ncbi:hypothetical protein SAMN05216359_11694 [Roseateles sp. YR242]|uniref:hypothetical protein n=1 Tax=Roseateles sp. YR242 TaxID=1855305 RepID=UPI0008B5809F|nr:hypothetical protein [Roseateles sp. YR242]SEL77532.1 hypothetical protein SAMN05216359_11694 [Roseateles sp. YR242]
MVKRLDKLARLLAVFDEFHHALEGLDDSTSRRLAENWAGVRPQYAEPPAGIPRSALAAGMEQGLRETPMLMQAMNPEARRHAAKALASATLAHYPDFLAKTAERITKVKARGSIRGESEFHLIRSRVDELEGASGQSIDLQQLYKLLDAYEGRSA